MKYNKPEVITLVTAGDAVQSGTDKYGFVVETIPPFFLATSAAYEADE